MTERRNTTRKKSFLRGCIYFNHRRSAVDCLIRDISETGARMTFSSTVQIPDVIELYIPQKEQTLRAEVQWRKGDEIGVAFGDTARAPRPAAPHHDAELAERVQALEGEVAELRKMLKRLKNEISGGATFDAA
jgi:hypothetical protein